MRTFLSAVTMCLVLLLFCEVIRSTESRRKGIRASRRNVENVEHGRQAKKQLRRSKRAHRVMRPLTHDCVCLVSDVEKSTERGDRGRGAGGKMDGKIQSRGNTKSPYKVPKWPWPYVDRLWTSRRPQTHHEVLQLPTEPLFKAFSLTQRRHTYLSLLSFLFLPDKSSLFYNANKIYSWLHRLLLFKPRTYFCPRQQKQLDKLRLHQGRR